MASFSAPPPYRPNRSAFWQESFYYLNAAAMPVKANSAAITAAMFAYHDGAGLGTSFEFRPFGQANWNAGNSAGYFVDSLPSNLDPATARRTWAANTTVAQQPGTHLYFTDLRQQGATRNALGQYSVVGFGDRHAILWSESSNELMECIGYSGYSAACMHNATFNLASYAMPFATNGTTPAGAIAPRFPVAPLFFTYQDLVDCGTSGNLGHMVGIVLEDYQNQRQWPSRVGDGTQLDGPKSGEVLRLRSDFDLASLPNDMMRALARTLQLHGAILYDRGAFPKINTCNDPLWTSAHRASFPFNQFECLDLSSVAGPAHSIRLASNPGGNLLPVPSFTFAPAAGAVPLTVNFNGSASTDPDGSISSYIWAFGDGASGTGATTSHTYSASGSFSPRLTVTDNLGSSATIAASGWTPSYPLDTPPGKVRFGVATDVGVKAKFEDPISKPVGMFRRFFSWTQATGGSMTTEVTSNYAAGRATWLSFKTPVTTTSWADVAAGTYQAQVDAFLVGLRNTGINCWLTPYHEPEDNASPEAPGNGSHLDGTPAQWRAMVRYIEARRKAVNANNVLIVPILMDGTFETGSSRTVSDWILPEADFPLYGFDPYTNGYTTGPAAITATRFNNAVSVMRNTYGKDIAIGEAGGQLGTSNPRPPDLWAAFVQEAIDAEMKAVCWFDNGTNLLNASTADVSGVTYAAVLTTFNGSTNYRSGILAAPSAPGSVDVSGSSGPANVAPTASASVVAASGVAPFTASFSSSGSTDSDGTIVSRSWTFGDGGTSTASSPTHTYTAPGTWVARVTVTDDDGATSTASVVVTVVAPTPPDPDPDPTDPCQFNQFIYQTSTSGALSADWEQLSARTFRLTVEVLDDLTAPLLGIVITSLEVSGFPSAPSCSSTLAPVGTPSLTVVSGPSMTYSSAVDGSGRTDHLWKTSTTPAVGSSYQVTITVADPTTCSQIVVPGLVGTGTAFALGGVDVVSVTSPGTDSVGTYGYVDAECTGTAPCPEHPEAVGYPEAASITGEGLELILGPALGSVTDLFSTGWAENVSLDDIGAKGRTCAIPITIPETATDVTVAAAGRFTMTDRSGSWDSGDLTDGASVILATGPLSGPDTSAFDVVFEGDFTVDVGQTLSFPATPITDITQQVWVLFTVPTREGVEQQQSWLVDEVSVTVTYCEPSCPDVGAPTVLPAIGWAPHYPDGTFPAATGNVEDIIASAPEDGWVEATVYTDPASGDDTRQAAVAFDVGTCSTGGTVSVSFNCRADSIIEDPEYSYDPSTIVAAFNLALIPGVTATATVTYDQLGDTFNLNLSNTYTADDVAPDGTLRAFIGITAYGNVLGSTWRAWDLVATATACGCDSPCADGLDQVAAQLADPVTFTVGPETITIESLSGAGGIYGPAGHGLIAEGTDYTDPGIYVAASYGALSAGTPVHYSVTASMISATCVLPGDPVVFLVGVIDGVGTIVTAGTATDAGGGVWHLSLDHVLAAGWPDVYVIAAVPTGCV